MVHRTMGKKPGLYIHIPFCRSKCPYCGFYSTTRVEQVDDFVRALLREMEFYQATFREFDTLYIGGGTPSVLSAKNLGYLVEEASRIFAIHPRAEITLEANPADIQADDLKTWRKIGINRLNLGVQSFDDRVLAFLGRRHDRSQALKAMERAAQCGFTNIGIDLIYGIPGQTIAVWKDTLHRALSFQPAHISCYQLTLEHKTPFLARQEEGEMKMPSEAASARFFFQTADILKKNGYLQYEVSNFARNIQCRSRHNQKYWNHTSYLGLGPSAHSFTGSLRWSNHRMLSDYLLELQRGRPPVASSETLTKEQLKLETLFLGLRTRKGIRLQDYELRFNEDLQRSKEAGIMLFMEKGFIEIKNGFLRPTLSGLAVADSLALM